MRLMRWSLLAAFVLTVAGTVIAADTPQKPQDKSAGKQRPGVRPGEVNTPPAKGERHTDKLKVGDLAPDFTLTDPKGKEQTTLSSFKDKKPVVLIFGSFT